MQNRLISPTNNIDSCQGHPEKKEPSQTITGIRKACGQQRRRQLQGNGSHSWDNRLFYARCGSFPFMFMGYLLVLLAVDAFGGNSHKLLWDHYTMFSQ
jgi:hypothetical protein